MQIQFLIISCKFFRFALRTCLVVVGHGCSFALQSLAQDLVTKPAAMANSKHANCDEADGGSFRSGEESGALSSSLRTSFDTSSNSAGSSSPYFSTRCQTLEHHRRDSNVSELDFQIQASKEHWSELSSVIEPLHNRKKQLGLAALGRVLLGRKIAEDSTAGLHSVESLEQMREVFERLKQGQHSFFQDFDDLVLRKKIAEGGQAEIFEAECTLGGAPTKCVVKVMKEGFSLQSLQSQWSTKLCRRMSQGRGCGERELVMSDASVYGAGTSSIMGATLLHDGRFAFVLEKYCGDLRNLIDLRMRENNNCGPPFADHVTLRIIGQIARGMYTLHKSNILHRDLKASNVLVAQFSSGNYHEYPDCYVADFECSVGVVGTGFWRAPEVLLALKNRSGAPEITQKADVYSFAMTCYEVLTGCVPFEGQLMTNYDFVLSGHRPVLPDYVDDTIRSLLLRCWDADPSKRPSFEKILKVLAGEVDRRRLSLQGQERLIPFYGWRSSRTWYLERYSDSQEQPLDSSP